MTRVKVRLTGQKVVLLLMAIAASAIVAIGCSEETVVLSQPETLLSQDTFETRPSATETHRAQQLPIEARVQLGDRAIDLEVARTPQQQALGLMFRDELPDDRGMLFPFDPPESVNFWMKNVRIPLDMVFVYDGEVVGLAREVPPCRQVRCPTYSPGEGVLVDYVIELRGGRVAELGLAIGDPVRIEMFDEPS
ncbi:hypothetical protein CKA32_006537 [Geitlerinema sp. FC II]|nr:DUF192 domain-containing protein [Geitlerinema sp. CS-897]PPT10098.1 hypothetical protein CKA32_006537 [Geitlerinema sp. FC II]